MGKRIASLLFGIFLGLIVGVVLTLYSRIGIMALSLIPQPQPSSPLIRCAAEVDTARWKRYQNLKDSFEVRYPQGFQIREETGAIILASTTSTDLTSITFEKIKGSLREQLLPDMHQAGWKILDRQVYALITSYFTNDDQSLSATYLFVRDFPQHELTDQYSMIKATITTGKETFNAAKNAKMVDPESLLSPPEQILSTFRFLQFDELPGRDTGRAQNF
jgi:hypothetical protein